MIGMIGDVAFLLDAILSDTGTLMCCVYACVFGVARQPASGTRCRICTWSTSWRR